MTEARGKIETGGKRYVFWSEDPKNSASRLRYSYPSNVQGNFVFFNDLKNIATLNSDIVASNYAELVDKYYKSVNGTKVVKLTPRKVSANSKTWFVANPNGTYTEYTTQYDYRDKSKIDYIQRSYEVSLVDGKFKYTSAHYAVAYHPQSSRRYGYNRDNMPYIEPTGIRLYAELESGVTVPLNNGRLGKEDNG